jgi:hypothetical protein
MNNSDIKLLLDFMKGVLKCQWDDDEHFMAEPIAGFKAGDLNGSEKDTPGNKRINFVK